MEESCFEQKHREDLLKPLRVLAAEIKWEVIASKATEADLVRVLAGLMVSATEVSAQIQMQQFYQLRATPPPPHQ